VLNPARSGDPLYDGSDVGDAWDASFSTRSGTWLARYVDYLGQQVSGVSRDAGAAVEQTTCGLFSVSGTTVKALLARTSGSRTTVLAVVEESETHMWRSTNRPLETCEVAAMKPVVASLQKALTSLKPAALDEVADPQYGIMFFQNRGAFQEPFCSYTKGSALGKECDRKTVQSMRRVLSIDLSRALVDAPRRELEPKDLDRAGRWGSFYTTLDAGKGVMRETRWLLFTAAGELPRPQEAKLAAAMRTGDCGFVSDLGWDFVRVLMRKGGAGVRVIGVWLGEYWAGSDRSREGGQSPPE
jgi:hypothetical protein